MGALLRQIEPRQDRVPISESTAKRNLKEIDFTYKRYRYSLKKLDQDAFEYAAKVISALARLDHEQQSELLYFNESGFSSIPAVQYGWGKIGQTRAVAPLAYRQRVRVLGTLRHDG